MPVAMRCCNFMERPLNQKPKRLRRPGGTWTSRSRASSLFAFFTGGVGATLGKAGDTVTLDGADCETGDNGEAAGAGCTAAGAGGGGAACAGWSESPALSICGDL